MASGITKCGRRVGGLRDGWIKNNEIRDFHPYAFAKMLRPLKLLEPSEVYRGQLVDAYPMSYLDTNWIQKERKTLSI